MREVFDLRLGLTVYLLYIEDSNHRVSFYCVDLVPAAVTRVEGRRSAIRQVPTHYQYIYYVCTGQCSGISLVVR